NGKATPQSRVPTLVVRERVSAAQPDAVVGITEPLVAAEDSSRDSLVIPIPDDELDRATRRRKAAFVAAIVSGVLLMVVASGLVLYTMFESDIRVDARPIALPKTSPTKAKTATAAALARAATATASAKPSEAVAGEPDRKDEVEETSPTKFH